MSKGHGRIERAILKALGAKGTADAATLAHLVAGDGNRSERESVRRALRNLQGQGRIEATEQPRVVYRMAKPS